MYERETYEEILKRLLAKVPSNVDKREGSVIWDALAPAAAEIAQLYIELNWSINQYFGDTADREHLIRRAAERGLSPKPASHAILKGVFNKSVPIGSRFSLDDLNYIVIEEMDRLEFTYQLQCETEGICGNKNFGHLIPIQYMNGLTEAEITELLIPGEEAEDTESFRERYIRSFSPKAFGGNRADYMEKIYAIPGVGGCKVYRTTNEVGEKVGGHVKCVFLTSEYKVASKELIHVVQEALDPDGCEGEGYGWAPIGHVVHVCSVIPVSVNINTVVQLESGYRFEDVRMYLEEALDQYLLELNRTWAKRESLVVRISQIESDFLDIDGVMDIRDTKINGKEENLVLEGDLIGVRGEIVGQEIQIYISINPLFIGIYRVLF